MALTRAFLKGMGLTEEQVGAIVEEHTESTDALKKQRDDYKREADELKDIKKELDDLKAERGEGDEWKTKYEEEHKAFEDYKAAQAEAGIKASKVDAYKALLKELGVSENRIDSIIKITNLDEYEIKDGAFVDADKMKESAKEEWKDFIVSTETQGAGTHNPPGNSGAAVFKDMSLAEKMTYANDNPSDPEVVNWLKA